MRVLLGETGSQRFRISQEGISVQDKQLISVEYLSSHVTQVDDGIIIEGYASEDYKDKYSYSIAFNGMIITQKVNEITTMVVNPLRSLYVEEGGQLPPP